VYVPLVILSNGQGFTSADEIKVRFGETAKPNARAARTTRDEVRSPEVAAPPTSLMAALSIESR
jgi:hypothetical protein